jgi:hypothetical protein
LAGLPDTAAARQHRLTSAMARGTAVMATKGQASPEVERVDREARALCHQVGATAQRCWARAGLRKDAVDQGTLALGRELGKRREASDLLASVYAWFPEGLDTANPVAKAGSAFTVS